MRSAVGFKRLRPRRIVVGNPVNREFLLHIRAKRLPAKQSLAVPLDSPAGEQSGAAGSFFRMTVRHHWQETHLDRLSDNSHLQVTERQKTKLSLNKWWLMEYTAPGTEAFTSSSEKGSGFVLHHVFLRLMQDEKKRVRANKDPDSLITPENYTLEVVGTVRIGSSDCSVVHAVPKRRANGPLRRGDLDRQPGLRDRENHRPSSQEPVVLDQAGGFFAELPEDRRVLAPLA